MKLKQDKTSFKNQLQQVIWEAWKKTAEDNGWDKDVIKPVNVLVEHPENEQFGDYTCNIAMVAYGKLRSTIEKSFDRGTGKQARLVSLSKSPIELAEKITKNLSCKFVVSVVVVKPGFINISINYDYLVTQLKRVLSQGNRYGQSDGFKGKKIMVEFAHPNTHKAFHIGHLRNIITGEAIVRILAANTAKVIRANYQGDVGMHIAKCLWGIRQISGYQNQIAKLKTTTQKINFMAEAYVSGAKAYEEDKKAQEEMKDINYLVYAAAQQFQQKEHKIKPGSTDYLGFVKEKSINLDKIYDLWMQTRQWSLDYFETIYQRVDSHFDRYYFESECLAGVDKAYEALNQGVLQKSQGAVVFMGKKYGLETRVFVNNRGLPTYEGKELALALKELSEFGHLDKLIHVVAPEQTSFFSVTFKVEELLGIQKNQQYHLVYGWVRLKKGKMSSRLGNVVLGEWLIDEVEKRLRESFGGTAKTIKSIAMGAVKYSFLKQGVAKDIVFDFEESISLQGNSGPYLQYTYARTQSVLRKSQTPSVKFQTKSKTKNPNSEELAVLRWLYRFPEVVKTAGENYAPSQICTYLYELAQRFNVFYNKHRILPAEHHCGGGTAAKDGRDQFESKSHEHYFQSENSEFRLALTAAVAQILKNGLYLLGIQAPEKM